MTSDDWNYYALLGIGENATQEEIRVAYDQSKARLQSNRSAGLDVSNRKEQVDAAYALLEDEETRAYYDRSRHTLSMPEGQLKRAQEMAISNLGGVAYNLGREIGVGGRDPWTERGIGGLGTSLGTWVAAYEAALDEAIRSGDFQKTRAMAFQTVWQTEDDIVLRNITSVMLEHRSATREAGFTTIVAAVVLGSRASQLGILLGKEGYREYFPPYALWIRLYSKAQARIATRMEQDGWDLTGTLLLTQSPYMQVAVDEASEIADEVLTQFLDEFRQDPPRSEGKGCASVVVGIFALMAACLTIAWSGTLT